MTTAEAAVEAADIVYLEGYLWDPPGAKEAFLKASKIAHEAGRKVALTLSDSFCVGRYRDEFLGLMRNGTADIVFANESELHSLYETSDFDGALKQLRSDVKLGVVTRSEKGCVVVTPTDAVAAPASPITQLVDTTGAGDLFAAGFLAGHEGHAGQAALDAFGTEHHHGGAHGGAWDVRSAAGTHVEVVILAVLEDDQPDLPGNLRLAPQRILSEFGFRNDGRG